MRVGFTGTRDGMTFGQAVAFNGIVASTADMTVFRHGCCLGADEQAARAVNLLNPSPTIFGHLSDVPAMTSQEAVGYCDDTAQPERPLDRNKHIVDGCDILIACPKGPEELRSGTWSTVRYARKKGKQVVIVWPNGTVTKENEGGKYGMW
jgi:hypothetical protein